MGLERLTAWTRVLLRTVRGNRLQAGRSRAPESYRFQSLAQKASRSLNLHPS